MQRLFIETRYEGKLDLPSGIILKLPPKIILAMPVQFIGFLNEVKSSLEKAGKKVALFQSRHGKYPGQILGCDVFPVINGHFKDFDAFFYVGDGKFHPTALLYKNNKPVYCYNPFNQKLEILNNNHFEKLEKRKKGLLAKFLASGSIGILTTIKPGQNQSQKVEKLRVKLEEEGKRVFVFLADEINFSGLENFNFIDVWINTSCPRLVEDFKCLNIDDLAEIGLFG